MATVYAVGERVALDMAGAFGRRRRGRATPARHKHKGADIKLNLVADYEIGGKRFSAAFSIDASQNLVALRELTAMNIPTTDGGWVYITPKFLAMCASRRKAEETEEIWRREYNEQGRLYAFDPVDRYQLIKESEVTA